MAKNFRNKLKKMGKNWKKVEAATAGSNVNRDIEGRFEEAILRKAELTERGKGGLMVAWTWEFPELKGKKGTESGKKFKKAPQITVHTGLESDKNQGFLKKDLATLLPEVEVDELDLADDLEQVLKELTTNQPTAAVTVNISDDGQWQNVWVNELVEAGGGGDDDDDDDDAEEDEDSDDDEDEDSEDEDDDDEDEKPKRGKKGGKKSKKGKDDEDEDDEEEEEDDDEDEDSDDDEEEEEEAEISKGVTVLYKPPKGKKQLEFTVVKVDEKKKTAILKDSKGKKLDAPVKLKLLELAADEDGGDEDDDEEEFAKLEKGTKVEVTIDDKPYSGTIVSTNDKEESCKVKVTSKGSLKGKVKKVPVEDVEVLD